MNSILSYLASTLKSLRLSLAEWLALTAAVIVGGLVAVLKVQGSQLHAAQLQLLSQRLDAKAQKANSDTATALAVYDREKQAFLDAGGKL
jgi:hypothetical protein